MFDLISVEKVIPSCDAVCSTLRAGMDKITLDMIARFAGKSSTVFIAYDNDETGQKKVAQVQSQPTMCALRYGSSEEVKMQTRSGRGRGTRSQKSVPLVK